MKVQKKSKSFHKVITLQEYIQTCGDDVKAISLNEEETVKWAGYHGYLYRFDPSESGEYIFNSNGNVGMLDYVLDENGNILKIEGDGQGTALNCTIAMNWSWEKDIIFWQNHVMVVQGKVL